MFKLPFADRHDLTSGHPVRSCAIRARARDACGVHNNRFRPKIRSESVAEVEHTRQLTYTRRESETIPRGTGQLRGQYDQEFTRVWASSSQRLLEPSIHEGDSRQTFERELSRGSQASQQQPKDTDGLPRRGLDEGWTFKVQSSGSKDLSRRCRKLPSVAINLSHARG